MFSKEALSEIDRSISALTDPKRKGAHRDSFCRAVAAAVSGESGSSITSPMSVIFAPSLNYAQKRLVVASLLRALDNCEEVFDDDDLRIRAIKLFDEVLSDVAYSRFKIEPKQQSNEKISKLWGKVKWAESSLLDSIRGLSSLAGVTSTRKDFMKRINDEFIKLVVVSFLPEELLGAKLDETFRSVEAYSKSKGPESYHDLGIARVVLQDYQKKAKDCGTEYSQVILAALASKLLEVINAHFENSPDNKPADVSVSVYEKKYPFHLIGERLDLVIVVKNRGAGAAYDVEVTGEEASGGIEQVMCYVGDLGRGKSVELTVPATNEKSEEYKLAEFRVSWTNYDGQHMDHCSQLEFTAQTAAVNWDSLINLEPYTLEPVDTDERFVGRTEILERLVSIVTATYGVGSVFVYGQKRVGKTSIARRLIETVRQKHGRSFVVVYLEAGDFRDPDCRITISSLGTKMAKGIRSGCPQISTIPLPEFQSGLAPITDYLETVTSIMPELRILFVIDEFDELPVELFKRSEWGDSFFATIRSISNKHQFGFVLIGGEKMEFVLSCQGDALNKFHVERVDYFSKENNWGDYQELVRRPTRKWLEISDDALNAIYQLSSGNPYFSAVVCSHLHRLMVKRRDCHVTSREVEETTQNTISSLAVNTFQHFWEDSIVDSGPKAEEKSANRRKLLLCLAELLRSRNSISKQEVEEHAENWNLTKQFATTELREFVRRHILLESEAGYRIKVGLFERWLLERGFAQITTTIVDADSLAREKHDEEKARIDANEIAGLAIGKCTYRGQSITTDTIRAWLQQFGDNSKQRMMFQILQKLRFYSQATIRQKLSEAHEIVTRHLVDRRIRGQKKRNNILVSYLDHVNKSGSYLARLYADQNEIYTRNVVERASLLNKLSVIAKDEHTVALVLVDDFLGSGDSLCEYLESLSGEDEGKILRLCSEPSGYEDFGRVQVYLVCIAGFMCAGEKVRQCLGQLGLNATLHICDPLAESDRVFSEQSEVFADAQTRSMARDLAHEFGVRIERNAPLGYGDCQSVVVFEHNCPNNSLPILWSRGNDFEPLFARSVR